MCRQHRLPGNRCAGRPRADMAAGVPPQPAPKRQAGACGLRACSQCPLVLPLSGTPRGLTPYSLRGASARNTLIGGPAGARRRWKLANRRPLLHGELSCPCSSDRRFPRCRQTTAGAPRSRVLIVAPSRQATSTWKVTASPSAKQAEEDTVINQAGR